MCWGTQHPAEASPEMKISPEVGPLLKWDLS